MAQNKNYPPTVCGQCGAKKFKKESKGPRAMFTCPECGHSREYYNYHTRREFSERMQKIAIEKIYSTIWSDYTIMEVDQLPSDLAQRLDIGGCDKLFFARDGHTMQVGQRFREAEVWNNPDRRDFTVRESEYERHLTALRNHGTVPGFYVYGYANAKCDGFLQLFIVKYRQWLIAILEDRLASPRLIHPKNGQERFYTQAWAVMPDDYILFRLRI